MLGSRHTLPGLSPGRWGGRGTQDKGVAGGTCWAGLCTQWDLGAKVGEVSLQTKAGLVIWGEWAGPE